MNALSLLKIALVVFGVVMLLIYPLAIVWPGVPVWLMTVALGMLIRTSAGQGVEPSFIAVAAVVLGVFLVGWRLVALPFARRRRVARAAGAVAVDRSVR